MAWRDILVQLRGELADVRARRQRQYEADQVEIQRQRDQLSRMARDLGIVDLIREMNDILLEGPRRIGTHRVLGTGSRPPHCR